MTARHALSQEIEALIVEAALEIANMIGAAEGPYAPTDTRYPAWRKRRLGAYADEIVAPIIRRVASSVRKADAAKVKALALPEGDCEPWRVRDLIAAAIEQEIE